MANAKHDENHVPTIIAVLNTDGTTIVPIKVTTAGAVKVSDGTTGTDFGTTNAQKDLNRVSCIMGISSVDGITPVAIYADSSGNLLVQST